MQSRESLPNHVPKFFRSYKLLTLANHPEYRKYAVDENLYPLFNRNFISRMLELNKVRRMLILSKAIEFDGKIFSAPTAPSFPSHAYDYMVKRGGLNYFSYNTQKKQQIESAFIAITNKCPLKCSHCYEAKNLNLFTSVQESKIKAIISELQKKGTNIIILTGGEPLVEFDKLIGILSSGDKNLSDFHLHTSGYSLTFEKARQLKDAGLTAAAVGLDDVDETREDKIRRGGSFKDAINALRIFNQVGILTYTNLCAKKELINSGNLYKYLNLVKSLNVSMIQLLEPRPCGGYFYDDGQILTQEEKKKLLEFTLSVNKKRKYKDYPLVYYVAHIEGAEQFGCCMGGLSHFYLDSAGNVNPCVFMPVTFGNINEEEFSIIYERMRMCTPFQIHKSCPSLILADVIRSKADLGLPLLQTEIKKEWNELFKINS